MIEVGEIYFLMALCPYMAHLKLGCLNTTDVKSFLRNILNKINSDYNYHLRSLCFHIPAADEKMVKKLKRVIRSEELLVDFTMKRVIDNIYIQWS